MLDPEFFRILAPGHPKPPPAFHIGGLRIVHFTSASALDTLFTIVLLAAVLVIAVIATREHRAQRRSE